jgi:hypothetical protein
MARKGARRITVDGTPYLWTVRRRPTYAQGIAEVPMTFVVEHADQPGARLVVSLPQAHPRNWMGAPFSVALPGDVATAITTALARGWAPTRPGRAFKHALADCQPHRA